jgi:hypothetical protein
VVRDGFLLEFCKDIGVHQKPVKKAFGRPVNGHNPNFKEGEFDD